MQGRVSSSPHEKACKSFCLMMAVPLATGSFHITSDIAFMRAWSAQSMLAMLHTLEYHAVLNRAVL